MDLAMFTAWNTARLTNYSGKKLSPLLDELKKLRPIEPAKKQTAEEIIAAMRAIRATMAGGVPDKPQPA